ncbi:MAG TPA: hypothetical protein VKT76_01910 [Bradyrhizobium sp.]|nr:hypothetical protein [Bradyrhizobium sp.]
MTTFRLIAAAALSLAIVGPAMAASVRNDELPGGSRHGRAAHYLRAQDFDHFNFGIARPTYHSGWSGPYGDGDYPGTIDRNLGPPYWGHY